MTTASDAFAAIRARLDASDAPISIPLRWQGEDGGPLPDTPAAFAYVVFHNEGSGRMPTAYGGGLGANLYRNRGLLEVFVFVPNRKGMEAAMDIAETIAERLRSYRDSDVSVFAADVVPVGDGASMAPPGLSSNEVNNYQCAMVEAFFTFDQIG